MVGPDAQIAERIAWLVMRIRRLAEGAVIKRRTLIALDRTIKSAGGRIIGGLIGLAIFAPISRIVAAFIRIDFILAA